MKRRATADMVAAVHHLGAPGLAVRHEPGRCYPTPAIAPHVVGIVDVDGRGIAGLELGMEQRLAGAETPLVTSLDARLQTNVARRLDEWIARTGSRAGVVIVQRPDTGEVLAMISKPDFEPTHPSEILQPGRMNRATGGVFEARQLNQIFALAQLLESDSNPDRIIGLPPGAEAKTTLAELFSNGPGEGVAWAAMKIGDTSLRRFYSTLHLLDALTLEVPETEAPIVRSPSSLPVDKSLTNIVEPESSVLPLASGEGLATTPLAMISAIGCLLNGGIYVVPTFLRRSSQDVRSNSTSVLSSRASSQLGEFFADQALKDPDLRELAERFHLGIKTSVDHLVINGQYASDRVRLSAAVAIPAQNPRLILYTMLDDPKTDTSVKLLARSFAGDIAAANSPVLNPRARSPVIRTSD